MLSEREMAQEFSIAGNTFSLSFVSQTGQTILVKHSHCLLKRNTFCLREWLTS